MALTAQYTLPTSAPLSLDGSSYTPKGALRSDKSQVHTQQVRVLAELTYCSGIGDTAGFVNNPMLDRRSSDDMVAQRSCLAFCCQVKAKYSCCSLKKKV